MLQSNEKESECKFVKEKMHSLYKKDLCCVGPYLRICVIPILIIIVILIPIAIFVIILIAVTVNVFSQLWSS
jgi:hypothetical protein